MSRYLTVKDVMTRNPSFIHGGATLEEAHKQFRRIDCRHLPVLDNGKITGVLSTRDFAKKGDTVAELMTPCPETVTESAGLDTAAALMACLKIGCLLVVSEGQLVGIVTTYDLLGALAEVMAEVAPALRMRQTA